MDKSELQDLLSTRLYIELQLFKDSLLQMEKEDIFRTSYKIDVYVNLYDIFMVHTEELEADTMRKLLNLKSGILEHIYQEWLSREDSFFNELKEYACGELKALSEMGSPGYRGEGEDGEGSDKAA